MKIARQAQEELRSLAGQFRAVAVVGPRQSGKTTVGSHDFSRQGVREFGEPGYKKFCFGGIREVFGRFS